MGPCPSFKHTQTHYNQDMLRTRRARCKQMHFARANVKTPAAIAGDCRCDSRSPRLQTCSAKKGWSAVSLGKRQMRWVTGQTKIARRACTPEIIATCGPCRAHIQKRSAKARELADLLRPSCAHLHDMTRAVQRPPAAVLINSCCHGARSPSG